MFGKIRASDSAQMKREQEKQILKLFLDRKGSKEISDIYKIYKLFHAKMKAVINKLHFLYHFSY